MRKNILLLMAPLLVFCLSACSLYFDEQSLPEEQQGVGQEAHRNDSTTQVDYEYQPGVVKLTTARGAYLVMVEADTVLYFMDSTPEDMQLREGNLVSCGRTEKLPKGVNGRVEQVQRANGMLRCTVTRVPLNEIFKTLKVEMHGKAQWQEADLVDEQGNPVAPAKGTRANDFNKSLYKMDWKFNIESDSKGKASAKYVHNGKTTDVSIPANLSSLMGKADFNFEVGAQTEETVNVSVDINSPSVKCYIEEKSSIAVKAHVGKDYKKDSLVVLEKYPEGKRLRLLDSPVAIDLIYGVGSALNLDLSSKVTMESGVESHRKLGFEYVNKKFDFINENLTPDQDVFKKLDVTGSSTTSVKALATVGLDIGGYVTGSVKGTVTTGLETALTHAQFGSDTLQLNDKNYVRLFVAAGLDAEAKLKFKGISLPSYTKHLAEKELFSKKWPLFPRLIDLTVSPRDASESKVSYDGQVTVNSGLMAKLGADIRPFLRLYNGDKYADFLPTETSPQTVTGDGSNRFAFAIADRDKDASFEAVPGLIYADRKYLYSRKEFAQPVSAADVGIALMNYTQLYGDKNLTTDNSFAHEYIFNIDAKVLGGAKLASWGIAVKMLNRKGKTIGTKDYDVSKNSSGTYTVRFTLFASADPTCTVRLQPYAKTTDDKELRFCEYEFTLDNPAENRLGEGKDADVTLGAE